MARYVLALDQGTTSSRSILFSRAGRVVAAAQREFPQIFPSPGHVEHDPEAIWKTQLSTARSVLRQAGARPGDVAAVGITNQRETVVLWERDSGRPVGNAIVWQSRITAPICEELKRRRLEPKFRRKTGLVLDAYFSGCGVPVLAGFPAGHIPEQATLPFGSRVRLDATAFRGSGHVHHVALGPAEMGTVAYEHQFADKSAHATSTNSACCVLCSARDTGLASW